MESLIYRMWASVPISSELSTALRGCMSGDLGMMMMSGCVGYSHLHQRGCVFSFYEHVHRSRREFLHVRGPRDITPSLRGNARLMLHYTSTCPSNTNSNSTL